MPWHDVACRVTGNAARDVTRHFVERWNWVKKMKGTTKSSIDFLMPPCDQVETGGPTEIQVLRSIGIWSGGVKKEKSIYEAYLHLIQTATSYIYIENQFFITSTSDGTLSINNRIGEAITNKIIECHGNKTKFRVWIILPLLPAFEGSEIEATAAQTVRIVMEFTYLSLRRGGDSIIERLEKRGIDWREYLGVFGLRTWGDLKPNSTIKDLKNIVTEMIYVHSKVLIVDDRALVIGSANINDRSLVGNRDSEVAVMLQDVNLVPGNMDGHKVSLLQYLYFGC